jgi:predicted chitinase
VRVDDIIKEVARRINGGGIQLSDRAKEYIKEKIGLNDMNTNPMIQALEEQFGENSAKLLTIQNYEKLKGLRFGGEYQVKSAHESMGNYTFMVENLKRSFPQNEELFRLRRVPEVKDLRLYRLSLQNRRNFITLPRKIIENPALLLQEMYALVLGESNPF